MLEQVIVPNLVVDEVATEMAKKYKFDAENLISYFSKR